MVLLNHKFEAPPERRDRVERREVETTGRGGCDSKTVRNRKDRRLLLESDATELPCRNPACRIPSTELAAPGSSLQYGLMRISYQATLGPN
jgi:hypothetical protein